MVEKEVVKKKTAWQENKVFIGIMVAWFIVMFMLVLVSVSFKVIEHWGWTSEDYIRMAEYEQEKERVEQVRWDAEHVEQTFFR